VSKQSVRENYGQCYCSQTTYLALLSDVLASMVDQSVCHVTGVDIPDQLPIYIQYHHHIVLFKNPNLLDLRETGSCHMVTWKACNIHKD